MKNPSRDQLGKSSVRRTKHLMIRVLEKFEDTFPDLDQSKEGRVFKGDLRNIFNDAMRAQSDELRDYHVEYRPLQLSDDNILAMTQTFMGSVQKIDFGIRLNKPYIRVLAGTAHRQVLEALRSELDAGVVAQEGDGLVLEIVGLEDIIRSVLPIMDRYRLHADVAPTYGEWRDEVVSIYRS